MKQEAEIGSGCDHVSQFKAAVTTIALQHRTLLERCLLQRTKRWFAQTRFWAPSRVSGWALFLPVPPLPTIGQVCDFLATSRILLACPSGPCPRFATLVLFAHSEIARRREGRLQSITGEAWVSPGLPFFAPEAGDACNVAHADEPVCECPLLARFGHPTRTNETLSGVKRT